jgi:hypothetical protein
MKLEMHAIAAYYVIVANDIAHDSQKRRDHVVAARPSVTGRVVAALTTLPRLVRSASTSQPA